MYIVFEHRRQKYEKFYLDIFYAKNQLKLICYITYKRMVSYLQVNNYDMGLYVNEFKYHLNISYYNKNYL